jgi:hypothetical protein
MFAFSVSQDVAITIQEWCTSNVDVGGRENSDVPIWAVSFVIIPCHVFMCWSGEECEKRSAGSWDMHWKEREESLWSLFSGQPMEFWHFCLYWRPPTSSRSCDEKKD